MSTPLATENGCPDVRFKIVFRFHPPIRKFAVLFWKRIGSSHSPEKLNTFGRLKSESALSNAWLLGFVRTWPVPLFADVSSIDLEN